MCADTGDTNNMLKCTIVAQMESVRYVHNLFFKTKSTCKNPIMWSCVVIIIVKINNSPSSINCLSSTAFNNKLLFNMYSLWVNSSNDVLFWHFFPDHCVYLCEFFGPTHFCNVRLLIFFYRTDSPGSMYKYYSQCAFNVMYFMRLSLRP